MQMKLISIVAALLMCACGSDDDGGMEATAGAAGTQGGAAGTAEAGSAGMAEAGSAGMAEAGSAGMAEGGSSDECGTIHTVTTTDETSDIDVYMDFAPEDITISVGDCVNFEMSNTHNAIEVSQETYESRGSGPLADGFSVGFGATEQIKFDEAGTHYYICQPHVQMDMVGTITVE